MIYNIKINHSVLTFEVDTNIFDVKDPVCGVRYRKDGQFELTDTDCIGDIDDIVADIKVTYSVLTYDDIDRIRKSLLNMKDDIDNKYPKSSKQVGKVKISSTTITNFKDKFHDRITGITNRIVTEMNEEFAQHVLGHISDEIIFDVMYDRLKNETDYEKIMKANEEAIVNSIVDVLLDTIQPDLDNYEGSISSDNPAVIDFCKDFIYRNGRED